MYLYKPEFSSPYLPQALVHHNRSFQAICSETLIKLKKVGIFFDKESANILLWHVTKILGLLLFVYNSFSL